MKKMIYTAVGAVAGAAIALGAVVSGALGTVAQRYDVNQDGDVDVKDIVNLMKFIANYEPTRFTAEQTRSEQSLYGNMTVGSDCKFYLRGDCEDFTDKELENVSELKVYGLTVKVKYDRSVTDKHSEYGYDIYRVEDMDAFFEANKDELTKRGFDQAAFDRIKNREGGDLIYVDRKTQAVSRVSLPIPVSIERFEEDDDIKAAIKNLFESSYDISGYNNYDISRINADNAIIAVTEHCSSNGLTFGRFGFSLSAGGIITNLTLSPSYCKAAGEAFDKAIVSDAFKVANEKLAEILDNAGYILKTSRVERTEYLEYDGRPLVKFCYYIEADLKNKPETKADEGAEIKDLADGSDIIEIAVFID